MPDRRPCDLVPPGQTPLAREPAIHLSALADQPDRLAAIPLPGRSPGAPGGAVAAATMEPRPAGRSEERRVGEECRSRGAPGLSSRRRHTRCLSDWSSDVCSSDLPQYLYPVAALALLAGLWRLRHWSRAPL